MKKVIFLFLILLSFQFSQAQSEKEAITTEFFKVFEIDPLKAYEQLFADSKWIQKSAIETNKIKLRDFLDQLGKYYGYEPITMKSAGESYILKSFLGKFERQPIRFTFILYKVGGKWQVQNFSFDDTISTELEEAAKIDRLRDNW
jgi:hypothetical protein